MSQDHERTIGDYVITLTSPEHGLWNVLVTLGAAQVVRATRLRLATAKTLYNAVCELLTHQLEHTRLVLRAFDFSIPQKNALDALRDGHWHLAGVETRNGSINIKAARSLRDLGLVEIVSTNRFEEGIEFTVRLTSAGRWFRQ